ncbi:MAG: ECF-type sigma factor [Lysobacterales bacterium]|nr:sigma-70 family RNA polymerase sigma factor [Xanthomonadales bacterium]MCP5477109.1 sigma-70 family RNA polymerase sigma factor [Rhodanobacteraceae bacterium]
MADPGENPVARSALDQRAEELYTELRAIAGAAMADQRGPHTLQPTALVHEAWLRLARLQRLDTGDRRAFLALAAKVMRHVLVDHARGKQRLKRGGQALMLTWDDRENALGGGVDPIDLVAFDAALERLNELDPRQVEIVEMRYLAGLSVEETAEVLQLSPTTVKRDAAMARAWVLRELAGDCP